MRRIQDVGSVTPGASAVRDSGWAANAKFAVGCALLLLGLLLLIDAGAAGLTVSRAGLWAALAVLLFVVLLPPRVSACPGLLASRGLLREHIVRTDRLVSVRWTDGVARRLVLRDADGGRVEIDPEVLVTNPPLWRLLDEDARASHARGSLLCGATGMRQLSARIDRETAQAVFKVSDLS
ncbi:hypothetical protein [Streptomyces sp. H27-C3]|uniref:hypothetical protein n=1 Tax=Streptomyces sp. H27-C3 TaxID=3046305 RepID=UPI0024BB3027|nr:hypothetical protein [Streptomyces sp. H27-C3]MDJ0463829.1 hypothetical protein [Streptomyces sp. H27-C3]